MPEANQKRSHHEVIVIGGGVIGMVAQS